MFPCVLGVQVGNGLLVVRALHPFPLYVYWFEGVFPRKPRDLHQIFFTILTRGSVVA